MQITFRANANVSRYKVGKIYTEELTPLLKALLLKDVHLSLIDPPTLEGREPEAPLESQVKSPPIESQVKAPPIEVRRPVEEEPTKTTKTKSGRKPVENIDKENTENESERESDEGIQDSSGTGALGVSD